MRYNKILSIVILYIFLAGPVVAQQNSTVEGIVVDQSGSAIPGVLIKISQTSKCCFRWVNSKQIILSPGK